MALFLNVRLNVGESYGGNGKIAPKTAFNTIVGAIQKCNFSAEITGLMVLASETNGVCEDTIVLKIETRKSVFTENKMAELTAIMLNQVEALCEPLQQETISIYVDGIGGLLVGKYRFKPERGFGVFNNEYFISWEKAQKTAISRFES